MAEPQLSVVDFDDIYEELTEGEGPLEDREACLEYLKNSPSPHARKWMEQSKIDPEVLEDILKIIDCYLDRPLFDFDD